LPVEKPDSPRRHRYRQQLQLVVTAGISLFGSEIAVLAAVRSNRIPLLCFLAVLTCTVDTSAVAGPTPALPGDAEPWRAPLFETMPPLNAQPELELLKSTEPWVDPSAVLNDTLTPVQTFKLEPERPTLGKRWIQTGPQSTVNEMKTLSELAERVETDLQNMQWLLEEQRRLAAGERVRHSAGANGDEKEHWLRRWLPTHWIPWLRAHREWVVAAGVLLIAAVWATASFSRQGPPAPSVRPAPPAPVRRRPRRRYREQF
jgi:hypothetical protein